MFAAIREKLKGWKTIIWSRALVVVGVIAGAVIPILGAVDGNLIGTILPPKVQPFAPLLLAAIGVINEWLRRITTGPVGAKGDEAPPVGIKAGD